MCDLDRVIVDYAIRYCLTRESYALEDGWTLAERNWSRIVPATRDDVIRSVVVHGDRFDSSRYPTVAAEIPASTREARS